MRAMWKQFVAVIAAALCAPGLYGADLGAGSRVYQGTCAYCHARGAGGAPRLDDAAAWRERASRPLPTLVHHALQGYGAMPPKGGNPELSEQDIANAVAYMVQQLGSPPARVESAAAPEHARPAADTAPPSIGQHAPPGDELIPHDKYGDEVLLGRNIFVDTHTYAGRYTGNGLTCANCHLDAGRRAHAAPLWAAYGTYPAYRAGNDRNNTLQERIQQCFRFSLNGFAPALDAPEIRALTAYIHFLSKGVPIGVEMPGRGFPQLPRTGFDPSPSRGADVYASKCALCHGSSGTGAAKPGGGYDFPPLWGLDSYNRGAGFARNETLAGFIKANMPLGQEWTLTDQEALDVASYINLQLRPWDPRKGVLGDLLK